MDGKELEELSDLWFCFVFFYLEKKRDDWLITEKTVKIQGLQWPQKTGGVSKESKSKSASCRDVVHGCLVRLMREACLHPGTRQPSRPLSLFTSLLVGEQSLRGESGAENLVGVKSLNEPVRQK